MTAPTATLSDRLEELARRVEALSGPCRETDAEIFRAIGAPVPFQFANKLIALEFNDVEQAYFARVSDDMRVRFSPPAYTASMDAVRTLIDPSDEWEVSTMYNIARATVGLNRDHQTSWPGHGEHAGCDPVLALLAAALRAQEAEGRGR